MKRKPMIAVSEVSRLIINARKNCLKMCRNRVVSLDIVFNEIRNQLQLRKRSRV